MSMPTLRIATGAAWLGWVLHAPVAPAQAIARSHDSAGIRIVENASRRTAPVTYSLGERPTLDIGGLKQNLDEEFWSNYGPSATRLSDGRIVIVDGPRLLYFSAAGKLLRLVTHFGAGPREFRILFGPCRLTGDTVIASDLSNARIVVFDPAGQVTRTIPAVGSLIPQACLDDRSYVREGETVGTTPDRPMLTRVLAYSLDGRQVHDFGMIRGIKNGPTGGVVRAQGDAIYLADRMISEYRVLATSGKTLRIVRTRDPVQRVTSADIAAKRIGGMTVTSLDGTERMLTPDFFPAFAGMYVAPNGVVWMQDAMHVKPQGWTAFDKTGQMLGRFVPPAHPREELWRVMAFGETDVMISRRDDDGAAHLTIYPLVKKP